MPPTGRNEKALLIPVPPRSGPAAAALILAAVALAAIFPLLSERTIPLAPIAAGLLFFLALLSRNQITVHVILSTLLISVWANIWPSLWPFFLLGPLIAYFIVVAAIPRLRQGTEWLRPGRLDRATLWLAALTVGISSLALWLWFTLWQPDLGHWLRLVPRRTPGLLILLGLGFALLNAATEESVYRGILMHGLDAALGGGTSPVILQAVPFGLIHLNGIPGGWIGVGMAMTYGVMLGLVRRRAHGMLAPFVAHVFADVVIFALLALWVT